MGEFGQDAGVTLGFLMTTESQDLCLTSHPNDQMYLYFVLHNIHHNESYFQYDYFNRYFNNALALYNRTRI